MTSEKKGEILFTFFIVIIVVGMVFVQSKFENGNHKLKDYENSIIIDKYSEINNYKDTIYYYIIKYKNRSNYWRPKLLKVSKENYNKFEVGDTIKN